MWEEGGGGWGVGTGMRMESKALFVHAVHAFHAASS